LNENALAVTRKWRRKSLKSLEADSEIARAGFSYPEMVPSVSRETENRQDCAKSPPAASAGHGLRRPAFAGAESNSGSWRKIPDRASEPRRASFRTKRRN
jgi:hypothetical protein